MFLYQSHKLMEKKMSLTKNQFFNTILPPKFIIFQIITRFTKMLQMQHIPTDNFGFERRSQIF